MTQGNIPSHLPQHTEWYQILSLHLTRGNAEGRLHGGRNSCSNESLLDTEGECLMWGTFCSATCSGFWLEKQAAQSVSILWHEMCSTYLEVCTHPDTKDPHRKQWDSRIPRINHRRTGKVLYAHWRKKAFSVTVSGGETRVNDLGTLPGVCGSQVGCVLKARHMLGLWGSPCTGQAPGASCRPKSCPRPSSRIVSCHTAFGSGDVRGMLCNIFKSPFPCSRGKQVESRPPEGQTLWRPHRPFANKRASKAGIYPKLSNWPSPLIWDLMCPNQTNFKSHLLNFFFNKWKLRYGLPLQPFWRP
jgi:hypothetical protein